MDDVTEMLAFVDVELFDINQCVWLACDEVPPVGTKAHERPTQRHVIAEQRIRAEVPSTPNALDGGPSMVTLRGSQEVRTGGKVDAWRGGALIAWFRANPAFGSRFVRAVDASSPGDVRDERQAHWDAMMGRPDFAQLERKEQLKALRKQYGRLWDIGDRQFTDRILPVLLGRKPRPSRKKPHLSRQKK